MGTRPVADSGVMLSPNHPHACGDKTLSSKSLKDCWGSSPRVWGQDGADRQERQEDRIIPTRMGTSCLIRCYAIRCEDHPHTYGDKQESLYAVSRSIGSSPRVWGQGIQHSNNAVIVGIIPTRMGTSALFSPFLVSPWDHPHAYGDK